MRGLVHFSLFVVVAAVLTLFSQVASAKAKASVGKSRRALILAEREKSAEDRLLDETPERERVSSPPVKIVPTKPARAAKSVVSQATASEVPKSRLAGVMFNRVGSNFEAADSPNHSMSLGSTTLLSYRLADRWQALGIFGFSKQMTGEERFRLRNTELRLLFQTLKLAEGIQLSNGLNSVFPTNLDSRQLESLYFGAGLSNRLAFDLVAHGLPGFSGWYDLNLNKNFHEFDSAVDGERNTDVMVEHFVLTSYALSERWAIMLAGDFTHNWDYSGGVSNTWSFTQELDFSPSKSVQFGIGHTNGGNVLGANGRSYNIRLFNPYQSTFYISANFVL